MDTISIFKGRSSERGFTLLELLMVVTILSTVAWMAIGVVDNSSDQVRFEDTRNRLAAIERAIIGDSSRTINGHPVISGYVADMGGLPEDLASLILKEYCYDDGGVSDGPREYKYGSDYDTKAECEGAGEHFEWVSQPEYDYKSSYGIWAGWRGPYINTTAFTGSNKFRDGWGNDDNTTNFGWYHNISDGDLELKSLGKDGVSNGTDPYTEDYPDGDLIAQEEYSIEVTDGSGAGGLATVMNNSTACWACDGPDASTRAACVAGGGSWLAVPFDSYSPSDSTDARIDAKSTCEAQDVDGDSDGDGIWLETALPSGVCWLSDSSYADESACTTNGGTWQWISNGTNRFPICMDPDLDNTTCIAGARGEVWSAVAEYESLCIKLSLRVGGNVDSSTLKESEQGVVPFFWDGKAQTMAFPFSADTFLNQGQVAFQIFEYNTEASSCSSQVFYGGTATWKTFTILPGAVLQPLEWNVE